jgi:hypothetical protein
MLPSGNVSLRQAPGGSVAFFPEITLPPGPFRDGGRSQNSASCQLRAEENAIEAVGSLPDWGQSRSPPQFERARQGIDADPGPP